MESYAGQKHSHRGGFLNLVARKTCPCSLRGRAWDPEHYWYLSGVRKPPSALRAVPRPYVSCLPALSRRQGLE